MEVPAIYRVRNVLYVNFPQRPLCLYPVLPEYNGYSVPHCNKAPPVLDIAQYRKQPTLD